MSTLYDIKLKISYRYEYPAAAGRSLLRIMPLNLPDQQLISGAVSCDPPGDFRRDSTDFFGNRTTELAHDRPLSRITFRFDGRVRRSADLVSFDLSRGLSAIRQETDAIRSIDPTSPHHFLGPSERVTPGAEISDFARDTVRSDMSTLAAVQAISRALHRTMKFDPESTEVSTNPLDAFRKRRGVCQDFTHIMIAALRAVDIPAGYVSGFIRTIPPEGKERLEGADAMHAWVRAWCGADAGWVQIDPTNDMMAGNDHVIVAIGRDYADVSPVKGSMRAFGRQTTRHEVDMVSVSPAPAR